MHNAELRYATYVLMFLSCLSCYFIYRASEELSDFLAHRGEVE